MRERLQAAESEISKRQHVLSMDHGGTPEERQAIADALNGMENLRKEVVEWQTERSREGGTTSPRLEPTIYLADSNAVRELTRDTGPLIQNFFSERRNHRTSLPIHSTRLPS